MGSNTNERFLRNPKLAEGNNNFSKYEKQLDEDTTDNQYENRSSLPQTKEQQPSYSTGFTVMAPNQSKRTELQRASQRGLAAYERWKQEHRPGPIHLAPEKLGGAGSMPEARQRQQLENSQSKLQKKLRREDQDRSRRQAEEAEHQKMKDNQREKALKLEEKNEQMEKRRRELHQHDRQMKTEQLLRQVERADPVPTATGSSVSASAWARSHDHREAMREQGIAALDKMKSVQRMKSETLEEKQKQQEEKRKRDLERQHRRTNAAFLDRLEAEGSAKMAGGRADPPPEGPETSNARRGREPQFPEAPPGPSPMAAFHTDSADGVEQEEGDPDYEWVVMKLQSNFPDYDRSLLEDIVHQCSGSFQQAFDLLN